MTASTVVQYVLQAFVGLGAAAIGASATLWNADRQRHLEQALEKQRLDETRKGSRRELEARLREFAHHVAAFRVNGFGEPSAMQETYNRLRVLMASETGAASLPSDELSREVYSALEIARVNLQTLESLSDRDRIRQIPPQEFHDHLEQSGIQYSMVIEPTRKALIDVFDALHDDETADVLRGTEVQFDTRMKAYAARIDAARAEAAVLSSSPERT